MTTKFKRKIKTQARAVLRPTPPRYYFAYGSNLCIDGMVKRCPDARKVKALQLRGCKLVFRGVADVEITDNENDCVEGGLWKISAYDESRLDTYEGVSHLEPTHGLYRKLTFPIGNTKDDVVWDCLIYKMNRTGIMPPSEHYFNIIKRGYADFGLDLDKLNEALAASWDEKAPTEQLQKHRARHGRPPMARRPENVAAEVAHELDNVVPEQIVEHFNDLDSVPDDNSVVEHFVPPDQWVEGARKDCVPPVKRNPSTQAITQKVMHNDSEPEPSN